MQNKNSNATPVGNELHLGIDIGGTNTKFLVTDEKDILHRSMIKTSPLSAEKIIDDIVEECKKIQEAYPYSSVGVGVPGVIRDGLLYADNLPFKNAPFTDALSNQLGIPVKVENDANCAGLGEVMFGAGKQYNNMILLTIGTGIGGCIITDKKLYVGRGGAGELGHFVIQAKNGIKCPCGLTGCFEQYASATALMKNAIAAAEANKESLLAKAYLDNGMEMNGILLFSAFKEGCETAKKVVEDYAEMLAVGIDSLINIFDPDAVVLAGGITACGDAFMDRVRELLHFSTPVFVSSLQNDAGALGATTL